MHHSSCFAARECEAVAVCPSMDGGEIPGLQSYLARSQLALLQGNEKEKQNLGGTVLLVASLSG